MKDPVKEKERSNIINEVTSTILEKIDHYIDKDKNQEAIFALPQSPAKKLPQKMVTTNLHTLATFQALVDGIIPRTPELGEKLGPDYAIGGQDVHVEEFVIWGLDHSISLFETMNLKNIPLSDPTAEMLDIAATHLITTGKAKDTQDILTFPYGGAFAALSPRDRLQAISILEQLDIDLGSLPVPYQYNGGLVKNITDVINRLVLFGYYSEWATYGDTKGLPPDERELKEEPFIWKLINYPGPAFGYRDFHGFVIEKFSE